MYFPALTEAQQEHHHHLRPYETAETLTYYPMSPSPASPAHVPISDATGGDSSPMSPGLNHPASSSTPMSPGLNHPASSSTPMSPGLNPASTATPMSPGLNPASSAPMSPGMQHAGMTMPPQPHHPRAFEQGGFFRGGVISPHRGGGRRDVGEFSGVGGAGRGNPRHRPPFRGRGRGGKRSGGGMGFHQPASDWSHSSAPPAQAAEVQALPTALAVSLSPTVWCDVCRVDCSSQDTFESHKNGKRHKKIMQRLEEIEARRKLIALDEGSIDAAVGTPTVNGQSFYAHSVSATEAPQATYGTPSNHIGEGQGGGKRMKYTVRPKGHITRVCTLCNAICNTLDVFESHLASKKHTSRVKRMQGPDLVYGPVSVYIPSDQPIAGTTQAVQPLFYGLTDRDMGIERFVHQQAVEAEVIEPHQAEQGLKCQQTEDPATRCEF